MAEFNWSEFEEKPEEGSQNVSRGTIAEKPKKGFLQNALDYEKGYGLALGQGLGDLGASIGNFGLEGLSGLTGRELPRIPHPNLREHYPEGEYGEKGGDIGEFIGGLAVPGGGYARALKAVSNPLARKAAGAALGALGGAAMNEEDRPSGAISGAVLGTLAPTLHSLLPSSVANKLVEAKQKAKELSSKNYKSLFRDAEKEGLHVAPLGRNVPPHKTLLKESTSEYTDALKDYLKNPTLENAHWAQSDLGKFIRSYKHAKPHELPSPKIKALNEAKNLQEKIKEAMFSKNLLSPESEYAKRYELASAHHAKNVIPYEDIKGLREYEKNKISPKTLIRNVLGNEEFMLNTADRHPELFIHKAASNPILKKILSSLAIGSGVAAGYKGSR